MHLASSLRPSYASPAAAFVDFPDTGGYVDDVTLSELSAPGEAYDSWPLNPAKQIDFDLAITEQYRWRVDGSSSFGVVVFACPVFLLPNLAPKSVNVIVPDQLEWPPELRRVLDAPDSAHMMDKRAAELGIGKHLVHALSHWSAKFPDFAAKYRNLSLGSCIIVNNIAAKICDMDIFFEEDPYALRGMLSLDELQAFWKLPELDVPDTIAVEELQFRSRLSGRISQVIKPRVDDKTFILKSEYGNMTGFYHELKVLLTLPGSKLVPAKPAYVATIWSPTTSKYLVCGFILENMGSGILRDYLPEKSAQGHLQLRDQFHIAKQLTNALISVRSTPHLFFSDLKTDNVIAQQVNGETRISLIDFEMGRNMFSWAPPEIYMIDWLGELARSSSIGNSRQQYYTKLLEDYLESRGLPRNAHIRRSVYDNPPSGFYYPWLASNPQEWESGMVYGLGKALWCIFEGIGEISNVLGYSPGHESEQEFADFTKTPEPIQELIRQCTMGSREWVDGKIGLFRKGGEILPRGNLKASAENTKKVIIKVWQDEVAKIESFVAARMRYDAGEATREDLDLLPYLQRPKLDEVLSRLEELESQLIPPESPFRTALNMMYSLYPGAPNRRPGPQ